MGYAVANLIDRQCETCNQPFKARPYQIKTGNGRFCSRKCRALGQPRESLEDRLWARVDRSGGPDACWPWTGFCNEDGYGIISVGGGKLEGTHRVAYRLQVGVLGSGRVLHSCDNPPCCNGRHLFKGSQADNIADMIAKGRHAAPRGERSGSARLTEEQVMSIPTERAGGASVKELAQRYGVHKNSIYNVLAGSTWRHLAP